MKRQVPQVRCAIYTRKSTEDGLEQEFNSLDAQREAGEAYITSQKAGGWVCLPEHYNDGGFTGGNMDRPALKRLLADIEAGKVDCIVVYKVDRLSRSLIDFSKIVDVLEQHGVSFVSVTQQFNTGNSMGRLMLNVLLSFAQFEREIISERTRDKIAAARRKGKWSGGMPLLGYDVDPNGSKLVVNAEEAERVRAIFNLYLDKQSLIQTAAELSRRGWTTKCWTTRKGSERGGRPFDKANLFRLLTNVVYRGRVRYKDETHAGEHEAIIDEDVFSRVQHLLRSNGRTGGKHASNKYGALLKGLLHCRPCNRPMMHTYTSRGDRRYRYYTCYVAQKQGWQACPSKSVPAEQIEQFVVAQIRSVGKDPTLRAMVLEQARAQQDEELAVLKADASKTGSEVQQLHRELTRTAPDAASNKHAAARLADLHDRLNEAESRLADLKGQVAEAQKSIITKVEVDAALEQFDSLWQQLSPREQARVIQLLVQCVEYDGARGKVAVTFHADGLRTLGVEELPGAVPGNTEAQEAVA